MSEVVPPPQVWPSLHARNARALISFLTDVFGFVPTVVYGEGDRVDHAELEWPLGGGIMLGSAPEPDEGRTWVLEPGTFGAYVVTDDPDGLFKKCQEAGVTVIREVSDTDYGSREFAVKDPEGNYWSFGTYRGAPRPAR